MQSPAWSRCAALALAVLSASWASMASASSAELNPFAPVVQQVQARFDAIDREINRLTQAGQTTQASELRTKLDYFRDELAGKTPSRIEGPELNVVGIYQGQYAPGQHPSGDQHPTGIASVRVQATDRPVILALNACEPVQWKVMLDEGAKLQTIILSGRYAQSLYNAPAGIPIETNNSYWGYSKDYGSYPSMAKSLYSLTSLPISSLQGASSYQGTTFTIGPNNSDWLAQRVLTEMEPVYRQATTFDRAARADAVKSLRFSALLRTSVTDIHHTTLRTAVAEFSPLGPVAGTIKPSVGNIEHLAVDPKHGTYYGTSGQQVYEINVAARTTTSIFELEWPCGLAFDTKRDRLVASSLSSEGFLYSYSTATKRWTTLSSLQNVDLQGFTYVPETDSFYGLSIRSSQQPVIYQYNSDGRFVKTLAPSPPIAYGSYSYGWGYQLMSAGGQLAVITPPTADLYDPLQPDQARCFLIDPTTGEVTYSGVIPEPTATFLIVPVCLALARRSRR